MHCPHCGKSVDATDAHCRHCGGALGASPSTALDALVEKKAREILAEQRAVEQRAAEEARRRAEDAESARIEREIEVAAQQRLRDAEASLTVARERREVVARTPRRMLVFHPSMLAAALLVALVVGLPAGCIGECASKRPMWGNTLCPGVCPDCRGPGVIETWHSSGSGGDSDHMGAYCHNGRVNVDTQDFWFLAVNDKAKDVELSWWKRNGLTILVLSLLALLPLPFLVARSRRRSLDAEASTLDDRIAALEATLRRPPAPEGKYR